MSGTKHRPLLRMEITILHALYNRLDLGLFPPPLSRWRRLRGTPCLSVTASDSDSFCWASSSTPISRIISSTVLIHELLNVDLLRDLLGQLQQSVPGSEYWYVNVSGSAARSSFATVSAVFHTQPHWLDNKPHLNNLKTHRSVTFGHCSATMMRKFWCGSCSCRAPVVLDGFVSRMDYPWSPVFDGAGAPWELTRTHHAPSRQDD